MIQIIIKIISILLILYGISVFMISSGTRFFLFWIVLGALGLVISEIIRMEVYRKFPSWVNYSLTACALIALGAYLCLALIIISHFNDYADNQPKYLIVLGAQVRKKGPSLILKYRLDAAREYLKAHPEVKAVLSGGQGKNEPETEAEAMRKYLSDIEDERLILEKESMTTGQNLANSIKLTGDVPVCMVTNNFHLCRAEILAADAGYSDVSGIAAGSTPYYLPNNVTREVLALVKEWMVMSKKRLLR